MRNWESTFDRLFDRAIVQLNGCWEFNGERNRKGYGRIGHESKHQSAHRVAYMLCVGDIPEGSLVLHTCDNPPCVNPDHLYIGTHIENMEARNKRNRQARLKGEDNGGSKLSNEAVTLIRKELASGKTQRELARQFEVTQSTIGAINLNKTWRHI